MVKLARIRTSSRGTDPLLSAEVPSSAFRSPAVQTRLAEHGIAPSAHHYVDVSSVAPAAGAFLSLGADALAKARALIERATSPDASLAYLSRSVVFGGEVDRVLSPLDGRGGEVGKFLCIGMNYVDHCAEQDVPVPTVPLVFSKFGSCVVGPGDGSESGRRRCDSIRV